MKKWNFVVIQVLVAFQSKTKQTELYRPFGRMQDGSITGTSEIHVTFVFHSAVFIVYLQPVESHPFSRF